MLTEIDQKHNDKVAAGKDNGEASGLDSLSLLKSGRILSPSVALSTTHLAFDEDIFKTRAAAKGQVGSLRVADSQSSSVPTGDDIPISSDKTRFLTPEPGVRVWQKPDSTFLFHVPKPDQVPPQLATLVTPDGKKPINSAQGTFDITGNPAAIDSKKPTVAFLEVPDDHASVIFDGLPLAHSLVSAFPAAEHGYNALILESKISHQKIGEPDPMPRLLTDTAESIRTGTLPLTKGDVLNVSLGNNVARDSLFHQPIAGTGDPTYEDLNAKLKPLGLIITPQNLEANRDKLLKALETLAKNSHDKKWQATARAALTSNAALKQINAMGIEVIHASGNDGADRVDLNFLFAQHQLSSVDPATQKADKFSNFNSLTEAGDGVIPIRRERPGRYLFGDISVPASDLCAINEKDCHTTKSWGDISTNDGIMLPDQKHLDDFFKNELGRTSAPQLDSEQGRIVAFAYGTSFINDDWLKRNLARLSEKKANAFQSSHQ